MRIRFVSTTAVVTCVLSFCHLSAQAKLIPIAITAEVTGVSDTDGLLEGKINIGDLMTGVYIYDSSTPDSDPWGGAGRYEHYAPPAGITLTVSGFVLMTDPDNVGFVITIENTGPETPCQLVWCNDAYYLESKNNLPLSNGVPVDSIVLSLIDDYINALTSDLLPAAAPILDDWETRSVEIHGYVWPPGRGWPKSFHIRGDLTSAVLIPEPAAFVLLGLGGLALLKNRGPMREIPSRSGCL